MAEVETTPENVISDFASEDVDASLSPEAELQPEVVAEEKQSTEDVVEAPLIDIDEPANEVEETNETLPPLTTSNAVEEVNCPDIDQDTDEAIVDGFPAQTKPQMNGSATATTPSLPTPTESPEGFEEITTGNVEKSKDDSLKSPLALWIMKQNLHPQVIRLIYWVELQRTTGVFGGVLLLLLSLRFYPLIGVVMTFALSLLVVAFLYRIGMTIVKAVQKTSAEHPFKHLLEEKIEISEEAMTYWANKTRVCINEGIRQTQCLFLVKDTVASLKAMIMFWLVSYIASCINFLTICILGTVVMFTVPKLYEEKQTEIDQLFSLVMEKSCLACGMIEEKLPEKIKVYLKKAKCD